MTRIKLRRVICSIFIPLLLCNSSLAEQQITKAIYKLPLEASKFKNKSAQQIAEYLKGCGVNAVVHVPLDNALIDQLHKNGIKAYAEIVIFLSKDYWVKHPESRPILSDGNLIEPDGWYAGVCASQEWLINEKIKQAEDIAKNYQIDGLWLDFIRWPTRWDVKTPKIQHACFCDICLKRFQKETGIKIPEKLKSTKEVSRWIYKNHSQNWHGWRCDVILDTIKKIKQAIKKYRKDAMIGIFIVPWEEQDYDHAIYKVIGQDIERLSEAADVFSPMTYHLICYKDTDWIASVIQSIKSKTDKQIWPIVQSLDQPRKMSLKEYRQTLKAGLGAGSTGVITFTTEATLKQGKWEVQKEIFSQIK